MSKKKQTEAELMDLCRDCGYSVRFDNKSGTVTLYEHIGEYECAEQALLALRKMRDEAEG